VEYVSVKNGDILSRGFLKILGLRQLRDILSGASIITKGTCLEILDGKPLGSKYEAGLTAGR
jgi:hypothetical protein